MRWGELREGDCFWREGCEHGRVYLTLEALPDPAARGVVALTFLELGAGAVLSGLRYEAADELHEEWTVLRASGV